MTSVNQYILEHGNAEVERLRAIRDELVGALEFYANAWRHETKRGPTGLGGIEWRPKEQLLDDCGNRARAAIAKAKAKDR